MTQHTQPKAKPGEFPLRSIESRAAARKLLENQRSTDDWKTIRLQFDSVEKAKEMARLFSNAGPRELGPVRLIDTETGKDIPFD
jgi:hypothetical protein